MKLIKSLIVIFIVCFSVNASAWFKHGDANPNPNLKQENFFGLTGAAWQNPSTYYSPGSGNPAVSTADYYHQGGVAWMRPYDLLDSACGATGISIAASRGRYVWVASSDHNNQYAWMNEQGFWIGFSNDPGVPPATTDFFYANFTKTAVAQVATITAKIDNGAGGAGNTLTVTAVSGGITYDSHANVSGAGMTTALITGFSTGTQGGIGTYTINGAAQLVAAPQSMTVSQTNFSIYQNPFFVCNPDDASFPFYVSGEGDAQAIEHEQGFIKSADLVTWSTPQISHGVYTFGSTGGWSSYQRLYRDGVNSWHSLGFQVQYPGANYFALGKWTSTDGQTFQPGGPSSLFNNCLPPNSTGGTGALPCPDSPAVQFAAGASPDSVTIGAQTWALGKFDSFISQSRVSPSWVGRAPINATFNILSSPTRVNVSASYAGGFPGPTFLQEANSYLEDGIIHYYAETGFPPSNGVLNHTAQAKPYLNGGACIQSIGNFNFTGSIALTTLHVTATPYNVPVGAQLMSGPTATFVIAQITTQGADIATYTVDVSQTYSSGSIEAVTCGGLWQQGLDYYTEIANSTTAATAAPIGVKDSCASSVASLTWFNALPQQTYRLYRGSTAGSQTTLVGDFTGATATDSGVTLNAVNYHKLVYLHNGVEQKNRVVSTYCSTSSAFVNAHLTRALAAGADPATCNRTVLDAVDSWLVSNSLSNNLLFGKMAQFCVAQNGSNQISKIFDIGTTRLPRGGDYTPTTTSTTYSTTGINAKPSWVNGTNVAWGYYGSGKLNNIRRKTQITVFSAYQKSHAFQVTPLSIGQGTGIVLYHSSGSPGGANFLLSDGTHSLTATATITGLATDYHSITGTYDPVNGLIAYADAVAGSAVPGLVIPSPDLTAPDALTGQIGSVVSSTNINVLVSGSTISKYSYALGYQFSDAQAQLNGAADFIFDKALTAGQISSFHTLIKTTIYGL